MFFVLFSFFKGLDPDNLKRGSRIKKKKEKQSHFRQFSHTCNLNNFSEKKGQPPPFGTLPTRSTNDTLLKGCRHMMYFLFTMLSRPSFFSDYLLLFSLFLTIAWIFFRLDFINKIFMFSFSIDLGCKW